MKRRIPIIVALGAFSLAVAHADPEQPVTRPAKAVRSTINCSAFYPNLSRRLNESGDVMVDFDVEADGTTSHAAVRRSSGYQRLDDAALACMPGVRFTPAMSNGTPIASPGHTVQIVFSLH